MVCNQLLWFLLTEEPPEIQPLSVEVRPEYGIGPRLRDVVVLAVEPWVPERAVLAAYREARLVNVGRQLHPPRERALELARFLATDGWGLSLRAQMRRWKELHPEWAVEDVRNFRKESRRAVRHLLGPTILDERQFRREWVGPI